MRLKGRGPAWAAYRAALRETRCMEPGCRSHRAGWYYRDRNRRAMLTASGETWWSTAGVRLCAEHAAKKG